MGAGASAAEGRVFCHHCGARTASTSDGSLVCGSCGATEGVEATDQRLPTTGPTLFAPAAATDGSSSSSTALATSGGAGLLSTRLGAAVASTGLQERSAMRVESVTVVATQRPEDGGLLLRVLPNVVARREAAATSTDPEDWEVTPEPACSAFVSRLENAPLSPEAADVGNLCVICSEDLAEVGSPVVVLSCGHAFHDVCIRRWLTRRHTCPTCRFEMEVDNVKYLRSIGLAEEADALEKVEQEKQARELQKQAAARRRWVQSMRRGDPVHFGLACGHCRDTPLIGQCFRCTSCEGYILCNVCHSAHEAEPSLGRHPEDHTFVEFGMGAAGSAGGGVPHGPGGQLTVLLPAPARPAPSIDDTTAPAPSGSLQEASGEAPGEAALAAAEAAFVAVRSLAFAPLAGVGPSLLLNGNAGVASASGPARAAAAAAAAAASVGGSSAIARGFSRRAA